MSYSQLPAHSQIHTSSHFNGYPVQVKCQPLMASNLVVHEQVLNKALFHHKRTCALRFELKLPYNRALDNRTISKFFDALRVRIKFDLAKKNKRTGRDDRCKLSYIWVCERSSSMGWHFHVIIFVNNDIYNCFGSISAIKGNMFTRIKASWASALGVGFNDVSGLIHIPKNPVYKVNVNDSNYKQQVNDVLYRLSYFAKVETKPFGTGSGHRFLGHSVL